MTGENLHLEALNLKLGRETTDTRLDSVPRVLDRPTGLGTAIPMRGLDLWNAYEVGFFLPTGKPVVFHMQLIYDAATPRLVESKSLKLFLNACSHRTFANINAFSEEIRTALADSVGGPISLRLFPPQSSPPAEPLEGVCLDNMEPVGVLLGPKGSALRTVERSNPVPYCFHTHLFRSNCPVTGQPDWAAVLIQGEGERVPLPGYLLGYLLSFREQRAFHETCCERIYRDLYQVLQPDRLQVSLFFTRRGGLDINPHRANREVKLRQAPVWRQ